MHYYMKKSLHLLLLSRIFFNIFFVLGCSASITPLHLSGITNFDLLTLVGSGILLWLFGLFFAKRTITRIEGGIMILCYVAYTVVLIYNT